MSMIANDLFTLDLPDENATQQLGEGLAPSLQAGLHVHLEGDLGAGKTTLVRAVMRGLGYSGRVKSPTYTLIEPYVVSRLDLYHFDFYRFQTPEEFLDAGLGEYFDGKGVCLVEWPQRAAPFLPPPDLCLRLEPAAPGRRLEAHAFTEAGRRCLQTLQTISIHQPVLRTPLPPA